MLKGLEQKGKLQKMKASQKGTQPSLFEANPFQRCPQRREEESIWKVGFDWPINHEHSGNLTVQPALSDVREGCSLPSNSETPTAQRCQELPK